ncbi:MAG: choice-of-anchor D domain-containing protein, partial [Planctomycetota bacterium]|nr:choice-of-anchor D domain-containing protein [Planctomycetota bacterium]
MSTVDFGSTAAGTPLSRSFTIYNYGTGPLSLDGGSLVLPNGFSLVGTFPTSVGPYSSASFTIRLDASAGGSYSGPVSFGNNDSDENPFDFTLSGQVSAAQPEIVVFCTETYGYQQQLYDGYSSVYFDNTTVGTPADKTFTIQNTGSETLTLDPASLTLPSGFSLVGSFPSSVAAGTSATVLVRLTAASSGSFQGTLSFGNSDSDENPFDVTLYGQVAAVQPEIGVFYTPMSGSEQPLYDGYSSLDFGSTLLGSPVDRTLTVRNTGAGTLTLDPSSLTLPTGFSLVGSFPSSVSSYASATFTVRLVASSSGQFQGTLSFNSNDADESPFDVTLGGTVTGA